LNVTNYYKKKSLKEKNETQNLSSKEDKRIIIERIKIGVI